MRISEWGRSCAVSVGFLAVAACAKPASEPPAGEMVACALDGSAQFTQVCSVDRSGAQVTVRRPDGGFRRFEIVTDGSIAVLDGADGVRETVLANGMIEVQIEGDRYRLKREASGSAAKP